MRVTVLLFARPREMLGSGRLEIDLEDGGSAADLFASLATRAPALAAMRASLRCAVGDAYCEWDRQLLEGEEVAIIPPTAGG